MNSKINKLLDLLKELYNYGILVNPDNEEIQEVLQEMYLLKRRDNDFILKEYSLIELIFNYETTELNIGGVSFYDPDDFIYIDKEYIGIGSDGSGDYIAIDKHGLIYNIIDDGLKIKIADSGENFIEKMVEIGKFNLSKDRNEITINDVLNNITISDNSKKFYNSLMSI